MHGLRNIFPWEKKSCWVKSLVSSGFFATFFGQSHPPGVGEANLAVSEKWNMEGGGSEKFGESPFSPDLSQGRKGSPNWIFASWFPLFLRWKKTGSLTRTKLRKTIFGVYRNEENFEDYYFSAPLGREPLINFQAHLWCFPTLSFLFSFRTNLLRFPARASLGKQLFFRDDTRYCSHASKTLFSGKWAGKCRYSYI